MSPRYTYITPFGIKVELVDYMFSENGIEGFAEGKEEGKYALVLIMQDGSVLYDFETDKTPKDMEESRTAYKEMAEKQKEQMAERSKKLLEQAAMMAGMSPEEYKEQVEQQQTQTTMEVDEDGEVEGVPQAPADYKPHAWFVDDPAGYA
jgi:hypothetical protein